MFLKCFQQGLKKFQHRTLEESITGAFYPQFHGAIRCVLQMWKLWLLILRLWVTLSVWNISLVLPAECPTVLQVPIIYEWWWKSNVFFSDTANCDLIIWHLEQETSFGGRSHLFHSRHVWSQRGKAPRQQRKQSLQWKYPSMDPLITFTGLITVCSFVTSVNGIRGTI